MTTETKEQLPSIAATKPNISHDAPVERQEANVKPHIPTHVVKEFVIHEDMEPFLVRT